MSARFTTDTPWGKADHYENLGQGVFSCSTPSHGGIFVPDEYLHNIPEHLQRWAAKWSGSRNWYEEDCCWAAVAVHLPHHFTAEVVAQAEATLKSLAKHIGAPAPAESTI